jgi:hypothetical protein
MNSREKAFYENFAADYFDLHSTGSGAQAVEFNIAAVQSMIRESYASFRSARTSHYHLSGVACE